MTIFVYERKVKRLMEEVNVSDGLVDEMVYVICDIAQPKIFLNILICISQLGNKM